MVQETSSSAALNINGSACSLFCGQVRMRKVTLSGKMCLTTATTTWLCMDKIFFALKNLQGRPYWQNLLRILNHTDHTRLDLIRLHYCSRGKDHEGTKSSSLSSSQSWKAGTVRAGGGRIRSLWKQLLSAYDPVKAISIIQLNFQECLARPSMLHLWIKSQIKNHRVTIHEKGLTSTGVAASQVVNFCCWKTFGSICGPFARIHWFWIWWFMQNPLPSNPRK